MRAHSDSKQAVGYIRVSTIEQKNEGFGLAIQEAKVRAYCTMRNLNLVDIIADDGISGSTPIVNRPGGAALFSKIGTAGHVVAVKLDRLWRSAVDCLKTVDTWDKQNVSLHLIDFGGMAIDSRTSTGKLFLTMLAGFAEFERALITERTKASKKHMRSLDRYTGGPNIPYGWRLVGGEVITLESGRTRRTGGHLEQHPGEQAVIALARAYAAFDGSLRAIATYLQDEGHVSRSGKPFSASAVQKMVKNHGKAA